MIANCGLPNANCEIPNAECGLINAPQARRARLEPYASIGNQQGGGGSP